MGAVTFSNTYRPPVGGGPPGTTIEGLTQATDFDVVGDGVADDREALQEAIDAAIDAGSSELYLANKTYLIEGNLVVDGAARLRIAGDGATIIYPSDDTSLVAGGDALSDIEARAAFLIADSSGIELSGIKFQGGTHHNYSVNIGPAVYVRNSSNVVVHRCELTNGYSLTMQNADSDDRGLRIIDCVSTDSRGVVTLGHDSEVVRTIFQRRIDPDLTGTGRSFTKVDASTTRLYDIYGQWTSAHVGRYIVISGSTSAGNDGTFLITAVTPGAAFTPATISYANSAGVTENTVTATNYWIPGGDKVGVGTTLAKSGSTMTLTSSTSQFASTDVGRVLHINKPTTSANKGLFEITAYVSPTQVRFENSDGVAEAFTGTWQIDGMDALLSTGSSHAIYVFAGRENVTVRDCAFIGIRRTCFKASGSALPIRNLRVLNNYARDCANFVTVGADDAQDHLDILIQGNHLVDVANGRAGQSSQIAIDVVGSRNVDVLDNTIRYTRNAISLVDNFSGVGGNYAIAAHRYISGYSQPLENLNIRGNHIVADNGARGDKLMVYTINVEGCGQLSKWGTGTLTKSGSTMTLSAPSSLLLNQSDVGRELRITGAPDAGNNGLFIVESVVNNSTLTFTNAGGVGGGVSAGSAVVRQYRPHPVGNPHTTSYCRVQDNTVHNVGQIGVYVESSINPEITGNTWGGIAAYGVQVSGCAHPVVAGNRATSTGTASVYVDDGTSWPMIRDNTISAGDLSGSASTRPRFSVADAGGSPCDYPLLGWSGRARPTDGKEEVVIAYGADHVDGDYLYVDGLIYTYKASSPTGNEFNSFAGLVTLINNHASFECADYGAGLSGGDVATQHLRIRRASVSTSDASTFVFAETANPNALVTIRNAIAGNVAMVSSRGAASTGPIADKTVVWTPCTALHTTTLLIPANTSARTLLAVGSYQENKDANNAGCCAILQHNESVGDEEFRWVIA